MGWSKSIIECCIDNPNQKEISFRSISDKMFKYYWNQTIFFDLQQSPNPLKPPVFISYVKSKIEEYQSEYGKKPIEYDRIEDKVHLDYALLVGVLKKDVSHRFLKVSGKVFDLYELNITEGKIYVKNPQILKEYSDVLFEIINYRWSQILETFNSSPRISKKIKITDRGGIKRKSLTKYHKYLSLVDERCFICDKPFKGDISIDHLIPWSFMFSDDIWNLVYTHKGCNSSKSNRIVSENEMRRLEKRNTVLLEKLESISLRDKHFEELRYSIEKGLLRKFWIGFK